MSEKAERIYTEDEIRGRLTGNLRHWTLAGHAIQRRFRTHGWKSSLMVVNAVGHLAETAWHHPDISASWGQVIVTLTTHSAGGVTDKDFALAQQIERFVQWQPDREEGSLEGTPDDPKYHYIKYD